MFAQVSYVEWCGHQQCFLGTAHGERRFVRLARKIRPIGPQLLLGVSPSVWSVSCTAVPRTQREAAAAEGGWICVAMIRTWKRSNLTGIDLGKVNAAPGQRA